MLHLQDDDVVIPSGTATRPDIRRPTSEGTAPSILGAAISAYRTERARADALWEAMRVAARALGAALEARDADTNGHSIRVAGLALEVLARIDPETAADPTTEFGFLLHDVGKIAVPDSVLLKEGPLTDAEWGLMRQHPLWGAQLLDRIGPMKGSEAAHIVRHHHERWDGGGYPSGLRSTEIPAPCRAFAVVDAFDAMTSDRPYRQAMPIPWALEEIRRHRGTQFDPAAVDVLERVVLSAVA